MTNKKTQRKLAAILLDSFAPKYIRCYDNSGETYDQYTIVFTGHYKDRIAGGCAYVGSSNNPLHPQGYYQHGQNIHQIIDKPSYKHLGKKIDYWQLPSDVRICVMSSYMAIWDMDETIANKYKSLVKYRHFWWTSGSGRIEFLLPEDVIKACHHTGECDEDVIRCLELPEIKETLSKLHAETIANELKEYGAWSDEELTNHADNLKRLLWIAAGDIQESDEWVKYQEDNK